MCSGEPQPVALSLYESDPHRLWSQMLTENHKPHQNTKETRECLSVEERDEEGDVYVGVPGCICALIFLHCKNLKLGEGPYIEAIYFRVLLCCCFPLNNLSGNIHSLQKSKSHALSFFSSWNNLKMRLTALIAHKILCRRLFYVCLFFCHAFLLFFRCVPMWGKTLGAQRR